MTIKHIVQHSINAGIDHPIIISGYKNSNGNAMQFISCMDAIDCVAYDIIDHLVESNECFLHPNEGDVTHWRSFMPEDQPNIRFQVVSQSNIRFESRPSILQYLISSALYEFVVDTNQDIMFIYGVPRKE